MGGQLWAVSTQGGNLYSPLLSKEVVVEAQQEKRFHQFCQLKEEWGKGAGETFVFDKYGNIDTQGGTLTETSTIPARSHRYYPSTATLYEWGKLFAQLRGSCRKLLKPFLLPTVTTKRIAQWTTRMYWKQNWLIWQA